MEHHWVFESFEASMPWTVVNKCNRKVHEYIGRKCKEIGVKYPPIVMTRLTQVYDGGAVLYFYFGFNWAGIEDPMEVTTIFLNYSIDASLCKTNYSPKNFTRPRQ